MEDLGFKGPLFTWEGRGVKEMLDYAVGNELWRFGFLDSTVIHLLFLKSNHKVILLRTTQDNFVGGVKPFKFHACWLVNNSFHDVVRGTWNGAQHYLA